MNKLWMILPMILILSFAVGCKDKAAMAELETMKIQAAVEKRNKEIAIELFSLIDKNDFDRLHQLFTDDFTVSVPGLSEPMGYDFLQEAIKTHYTAFPDWMHVIEDLIADGDKVAIKLIQNGTHKAEYERIPATGIKATMPAMHLITIADGKIKSWFAIEDYLGLYTQLGMELMQKETPQTE